MRIIGPILGTILFAIDVVLPYQVAAILLVLGFLSVLLLLRVVQKIPIVSSTNDKKVVG